MFSPPAVSVGFSDAMDGEAKAATGNADATATMTFLLGINDDGGRAAALHAGSLAGHIAATISRFAGFFWIMARSSDLAVQGRCRCQTGSRELNTCRRDRPMRF